MGQGERRAARFSLTAIVTAVALLGSILMPSASSAAASAAQSPTPMSTLTPGAPTPSPEGPKCAGKSPTITGTEGDDAITGTSGADVIMAGGGNDTIRSLEGEDVICGEDGDDVIEGGPAENYLFGGAGNDEIRGGGAPSGTVRRNDNNYELGDRLSGDDGNDTIYGSESREFLSGDDGNDTIYGFGGNDGIHGGGGADSVFGGEGDDLLNGDGDYERNGQTGEQYPFGDDMIDGGPGIDVLRGTAGVDTLVGGPDDDYFSGGTGDDSIDGGEGSDHLRINENAESGPLTADLTVGRATTSGGTDTLSSIENVIGTWYGDTIIGNDDANEIESGHGDDTVDGRGGNDTIIAGEPHSCTGSSVSAYDGGDDTVNGGSGDDFIHGGAYGCRSSGDGNDLLTGDDGNDTIFGDTGNDTVHGSAGDDFLSGQGGIDSLDGGDGTDRCIEGDPATACETVNMAMDCEDGEDNDGDYEVDFPADDGCTSATDDYEGYPAKHHYHAPDPSHVLSLNEQTSTFSGDLDLTEGNCEPDRSIVVYEVGSSEEIGRTTTDEAGSWSLDAAPPLRGTYEANAEPGSFTTDGGDVVACGAFKSNRVAASPLLPPPTVSGSLALIDSHCGTRSDDYGDGDLVECARVYQLQEDASRDPDRAYGLLWYQMRFPRTPEGYCTKRVSANPPVSQMQVLGFKPKGRREIRSSRKMTLRIRSPRSEVSSVTQTLRIHPREIEGRRLDNVISLTWRGSRKAGLLLVVGAQVSWDRDAPPDAGAVLNSPTVAQRKRRTC